MATYYARLAGNINASNVWATTPSGTAAAVTFASGDVLVANSFTVTVNVSVDLGSTGQVRNDTFGGATNGGGFVLKPDQTLTATVITGTIASCLTFSDAGSTYVVGTINANATNASTSGLVNSSSTGTVFVTGNVVGSSGGANAIGITNSAGGVINVTGSVLGASGTAMRNSAGGTIIVTGPVEAGLGVSGFGHGILNAAAGTIQVVGNVTASSNLPAISSTNASSVVRVSGSFIHAVNGQVPIASNRVLLNTTPTLAFTRYAVNGTGTYFDMFTADNTGLGPATGNVRAGVSYGGMTGTLAVPLPSQVAVGVATDNTVGTAALSVSDVAAAVWGAATRTLTAGAGISASDVWSHASRTLTTSSGPTAVQIRQEMDSNSTKLANLDATTSSRLASSAYSAAPTTAQIATAVEGSLLNEADGQAVLNAIVGAIGNTNLSELSLVAAVRADLERVGGKIDSIPAAPTAAANATAVWATATKTITGGTVDTLTNSPSVPSAASIASATRTELTTELGRLDVATSTRLASSGYTAPANSDVAAIKAKSDLLNTDRLANVATTAIVGNLIAQANS